MGSYERDLLGRHSVLLLEHAAEWLYLQVFNTPKLFDWVHDSQVS